MGTKAVLYARVSTNEQSDNTSLDGQIAKAAAHAKSKGYQVVDEIREVHSGADPDRPGLNRIRDMARSGRVDVVLFYAFDRFMRNETEAVIVENELARAGVKLEFMDLPEQTNEAYRIAKSLYRTFADMERRKIAKRMHGGKADHVASGHVVTAGKAPFGYREVERDGMRTFAIRDDEAEVVKEIFRLYTIGDGKNGPLSIRGIAIALTARRVATYTDRRDVPGLGKRRNGYGKWTPGVVSAMLANETYAGTWRYGKDAIPVSVPAIIGDATWHAAQERKSHNRKFARRNAEKHRYLLLYRLRCGHCGNKMTHYTTKGHPYYDCSSHSNLTECDLHATFRADHVDAECWGWIRDLLGDPERLRKGLLEFQEKQREITRPQRERLKSVQKTIAALEAKRGRLMDAYLDGRFDLDELDAKRGEIDERLGSYQERRGELAAIIEEHQLSNERLETLTAWAAEVAPGIEAAESDFDKRARVADMLNVTGELSVEDGEKIARFHCVLGDSGPVFASESACAPQTRSSRWRR